MATLLTVREILDVLEDRELLDDDLLAVGLLVKNYGEPLVLDNETVAETLSNGSILYSVHPLVALVDTDKKFMAHKPDVKSLSKMLKRACDVGFLAAQFAAEFPDLTAEVLIAGFKRWRNKYKRDILSLILDYCLMDDRDLLELMPKGFVRKCLEGGLPCRAKDIGSNTLVSRAENAAVTCYQGGIELPDAIKEVCEYSGTDLRALKELAHI